MEEKKPRWDWLNILWMEEQQTTVLESVSEDKTEYLILGKLCETSAIITKTDCICHRLHWQKVKLKWLKKEPGWKFPGINLNEVDWDILPANGNNVAKALNDFGSHNAGLI